MTSKPKSWRLVFGIGGFILSAYLVSYLILSSLGNYYIAAWGPSANAKGYRVIAYRWFPAGMGWSTPSKKAILAAYAPLVTLDNYIWHNGSDDSSKYVEELP